MPLSVCSSTVTEMKLVNGHFSNHFTPGNVAGAREINKNNYKFKSLNGAIINYDLVLFVK